MIIGFDDCYLDANKRQNDVPNALKRALKPLCYIPLRSRYYLRADLISLALLPSLLSQSVRSLLHSKLDSIKLFVTSYEFYIHCIHSTPDRTKFKNTAWPLH